MRRFERSRERERAPERERLSEGLSVARSRTVLELVRGDRERDFADLSLTLRWDGAVTWRYVHTDRWQPLPPWKSLQILGVELGFGGAAPPELRAEEDEDDDEDEDEDRP